MRASLVPVILSGIFFLAGCPGLADNQAAASKAVVPPAGAAPAANQAAPNASLAPEKEAAGKPPGSAAAPNATNPSATAPSQEATAPAAGASSPTAVPAAGTASATTGDSAALEPHKRPVPEGYAAAAELFKQRKFPQAEKEFEKIIQGGTADINTHLCLAHCFLQQKIYSKAIKEFDWLAKYAKNSMTLQKSCEQTARSLRNAMNGICPANCLKGNDPRWTLKAGAKVILVPHNGGGYDTITPENIGHLVVYEHGNSVVKGICPVCEGTTTVPVLKDGGPMPRI